MITSNATFNTYNALAVKSPVFIVKLENVSTYFSTGPFVTSGETVKYNIFDYEFSTCTVNLDQAFPGNGTGYFTVIEDSSSTVFGILKNNIILGKEVTIYQGFQQIALANFITFKKYFVYDYEILDNGTQIKFLIEQKSPALDAIYNKSFFPTDVKVTSSLDYDYIIHGVSPNVTFEYEDNNTTTKEKMLNVNFADIMLASILSPSGGGGLTFDSFLYQCMNDGANIAPTYVETYEILEQGRRFHNAQSSIAGTTGPTYTENDRREKYVVKIASEQNIKTFLESIADDFFFRFYIKGNGKLSGKCISYYQNILDLIDYTIDQDSSLIPILETKKDYLFNSLRYYNDNTDETNDYSTSQTNYDHEYAKELESPGFDDSDVAYTDDVTNFQGYKLLDTFGDMITQITIPAFTQHLLVEPFDIIKYSNNKLNSVAAVTPLVDMPVMVSNVRYSYNSGSPLVTITGFMFDYFLKTGGRLTTLTINDQTSGVTPQTDCGLPLAGDFSMSIDVGDDAYFKLSSGVNGYNIVWLEVDITPPSQALTPPLTFEPQQIKLGAIVFSDSGAGTICGRNTSNIVYDAHSGSLFTTFIPVLIHDTTTAWNYAKLDLYEENHLTSYSDPTVTLKNVYAFKFRSA